MFAAGETPQEIRARVGDCASDVRLAEDDRELLGLGAAGESPEYVLGVPMNQTDAERVRSMQALRDTFEPDALRSDVLDRWGDAVVSVTWSLVYGVEFRFRQPIDESQVADLATTYGLGESYRVVFLEESALSAIDRVKIVDDLRTDSSLRMLDDAGVINIDFDARCGKVELIVAPGRDLDTAAVVLAELLAEEQVSIRQGTVDDLLTETVGRVDLQTTQSGGLRYVAGGGGCTSAAPWYRSAPLPNGGSYPIEYAVTAAHCVPQSQWASRPNNWVVWWQGTTTNTNLKQPTTTIATASGSIQYGGGLDVVVWQLSSSYSSGAARSAINTDAHNLQWHSLGWWQWSANYQTSTSGGDMDGDWVCQSGQTSAYRVPGPGQTTLDFCGEITDRYDQHSAGSPIQSWFYGIRETSADICAGDSGGTFWRAGWYAGIAKTGRGTSHTTANGQDCFPASTFSHVGNIPGLLPVDAPVGFS